MKWLLAILAIIAPAGAHAQVMPKPGAGDPRVQSVEYSADQVVVLQVAPGYQMSVEFAPDERIENVAIGDSGAWQATPNKRGDRLFIKPVQGGVSTNMVVVTDARTYAFDLRPAFGGDMAYTVRFTYPGTPDSSTTETAAADAPRGRYRLTGDAAIRPSGIDDDGNKTYIEWPGSATLPAVYSVDASGKEALVTGYMRDGIFVIDSVMPRLIFRLDRQVARAVRVDPQAQARAN